jgi:hypothetical protein
MDGGMLVCRFPASADGPLSVGVHEGSDLKIMRYVSHQNDEFTYTPASSTEFASPGGMHAATASITVSVRDLAGSVVNGLEKDNFTVGYRGNDQADLIAGEIKEATATAAGTYRLIVTFDEIDGLKPSEKELSVTVVNKTHRFEVVQ